MFVSRITNRLGRRSSFYQKSLLFPGACLVCPSCQLFSIRLSRGSTLLLSVPLINLVVSACFQFAAFFQRQLSPLPILKSLVQDYRQPHCVRFSNNSACNLSTRSSEVVTLVVSSAKACLFRPRSKLTTSSHIILQQYRFACHVFANYVPHFVFASAIKLAFSRSCSCFLSWHANNCLFWNLMRTRPSLEESSTS